MAKSQRVRDPVHDLIEFGAEKFDQTLWSVVETRPFQRLRRIKQLGFSEFVFPGATHTRFAHSLGVFHTARLLMRTIERHQGSDFDQDKANRAIAAALVHDLGHGPFSHSFEKVGERFGWEMANHEALSVKLICEGEVAEVLNGRGSGFADDVASIIQNTSDIYGSVVSSQFDADRLDYMRRDRLMTGSQHSAIDFKWLLENLEVGSVSFGEDETKTGELETFVLGKKAVFAAEAYVLALFQLYPTVYLHKTTRCAESMFAELIEHCFRLIIDGSHDRAGLPETHPLVRYARDPSQLDNMLALDDAVIWGAMSMMAEAKDKFVADMAARLLDRKLFKAIDVRQLVAAEINRRDVPDDQRHILIDRIAVHSKVAIQDEASEGGALQQRILIDEGVRSPYKKFSESKGPLNQIRIRVEGGQHVDLGERSPVVKAIEPFKFLRVYASDEDEESRSRVKAIIEEQMGKSNV